MDTTRRKAILLVEDEALIALAEKSALTRLGYSVETALTGEAAVARVRERDDFDLILMDIDLGRGMDGTQAAELILKTRDIPILFLSSHTAPEVVEKTEKITSYGYVVKDSNPTVLDASIKMAFKLFQANRETRKANEKFQALIEAFPDLMMVMDRNGRIRDFARGPGFGSLALPEESVVGAHLDDVFPPDEVAIHLRLYEDCLSTGKVQEHTYSLVINGEKRLFDLRISRLDADLVLAVIRDITQERRADRELRKLSQAIEQSSSVILITDRENRIEYVNPRFQELSGYSLEEARGQKPWILQRTIIDRKDFDELLEITSSGRTWRGNFVNRKKSGEIYHESAVVSPVRDENGEITNYISIKEDLTDQRAAQEALISSRDLLNEMGSIARIGGWKTDLKTREIQWTDEVYSIYEVDRSFSPSLDAVLGFFLPESRRLVAAATARTMETGEPFDVEAELITGKGNRRWIRLWGRLGYTDGRVTHRVGVSQDITEKKLSQELLSVNEKKILALLGEKETLLKEVHHRIKNNLAAMMSLLSLQAEGIQDPVAAAALKDARSRFRSMGILYDKLHHTDNLREMSTRDYLPSLIDDIVRMSPKSSRLVVESNIQDFTVPVKELTTLGLIVNELLTNAMKHAFPYEGGGLLRVSATKEGDLATLTVEDNGIGISGGKGGGKLGCFGLALVQTLTSQLRGELRIEEGAGTRVVLEFRPSPPEE